MFETIKNLALKECLDLRQASQIPVCTRRLTYVAIKRRMRKYNTSAV